MDWKFCKEIYRTSNKAGYVLCYFFFYVGAFRHLWIEKFNGEEFNGLVLIALMAILFKDSEK